MKQLWLRQPGVWIMHAFDLDNPCGPLQAACGVTALPGQTTDPVVHPSPSHGRMQTCTACCWVAPAAYRRFAEWLAGFMNEPAPDCGECGVTKRLCDAIAFASDPEIGVELCCDRCTHVVH